MEEQGQKCRRVVLVPCPYQGHITPMLQLGSILHSKGLSITVVHTQFNSPNPSLRPEFDFRSLPDGVPDHIISTANLVDTIALINVNCLAPFRKCLDQMMEQHGQYGEIVCIIYDELMYFSEAAANQLKLKSMILRTTSAATLTARVAIFRLKEEGYIPLKDTILHDPVPWLHPLRFKDLPVPGIQISESLLQLITNMYKIRTSSAVIWNTTDCLEKSVLTELQQQCQVPNFPLGPLPKIAPSSSSGLFKEDTSCIAWLNNQAHKSVIYVSLGSIASIDNRELVEMAWGLANSKQPFLWVVRPTSINGTEETDLLPEGFKEAVGENGCIVKWAPQKEVLAHSAIGGFWSHCGWNSVLESICEGVPMICRPCFGDQWVNAGYVSQVWKIGLELGNKLDREEMEKTVRRLMVEKEGGEIRHRIKNLRKEIELSITKGGSSYKSLSELLELIN
ncbi:hypothetical protein Pint_32665 [Pistacia integerrima]|uniref:Uncharacterized protein n=1 Tax=Pistacia integerrima TaxID=434235 RepID=A0ACC0XNW0_9ROSI|nr:hypothetical protein Pint_32665 [Pistacia integerrima]